MALAPIKLTARGAGALVGAFVVLVLAFYTTNVLLFLIAFFLLGVVLSTLVAFAYATRGFAPEAFDVERIESSSLVKVGAPGLLAVRLSSRLRTGFYAEVSDPHSDRLRVLEGNDRLVTWWPAEQSVQLAYVISPELRGLLEVGPTVVVAHDTLGFAFKTVTVDDEWSIEALLQPPSLPIGHPVRLASNVVGQTSLSARGAGTDFRGLREYDPSDELRNIAWSRSTQGTLYVREFDRESQQDLIAVVDIGRGMATGVGRRDALEDAVGAAARALRAAFDEGGRGGVVLFDDGIRAFVEPGRGTAHEFEVLRALTGVEPSPKPSSLSGALRYLLPQLHRPASVLLFTSPGDDVGKITTEASGFRPAGHRIYAAVPDVTGMYPELTDVVQQEAFRTILEPEVRRTRSVADALTRTGASVGLYGRDGATSTVAQLFARDPRSAGGR